MTDPFLRGDIILEIRFPSNQGRSTQFQRYRAIKASRRTIRAAACDPLARTRGAHPAARTGSPRHRFPASTSDPPPSIYFSTCFRAHQGQTNTGSRSRTRSLQGERSGYRPRSNRAIRRFRQLIACQAHRGILHVLETGGLETRLSGVTDHEAGRYVCVLPNG